MKKKISSGWSVFRARAEYLRNRWFSSCTWWITYSLFIGIHTRVKAFTLSSESSFLSKLKLCLVCSETSNKISKNYLLVCILWVSVYIILCTNLSEEAHHASTHWVNWRAISIPRKIVQTKHLVAMVYPFPGHLLQFNCFSLPFNCEWQSSATFKL